MGNIQKPNSVLLVISIFSRYSDIIFWGQNAVRDLWGPIELQSAPFSFTETNYYQPTMGSNISLVLIAFSNLIDPNKLVEIKHQTNSLEQKFADQGGYPEERPLNLDPGYITPAKYVLATTKNAAHRLYLGKGIFGEITLKYTQKKWQDQEWTYPNYKRQDYKEFFLESRRIILKKREDVTME